MFSNKVNHFEIYDHINNEFTAIKNLDPFINYTGISPTDLITIANITFTSIDKLGDLSAIYVKKINESCISVSTVEKIQRMYDIHNELLGHMYKFNTISSNVSDRFMEISVNNLNKDVINFINYDIINRHKLTIYMILDSIKKLKVFMGILKDKI